MMIFGMTLIVLAITFAEIVVINKRCISVSNIELK